MYYHFNNATEAHQFLQANLQDGAKAVVWGHDNLYVIFIPNRSHS